MYIFEKYKHNKSGDDKYMNMLQKICLIFTVIGALNWGLIGLLDINLVTALFGNESMVTNATYLLIGLCGLVNIWLIFTNFNKHDEK